MRNCAERKPGVRWHATGARRVLAWLVEPGAVDTGRQAGLALEHHAHVLHVAVPREVRHGGQRQVGFRQEFLDALDLDARDLLVGCPAEQLLKTRFQAMLERAARAAGFDMKIHPHMPRHSCGYKLANDGVDTRTIQSYLGHKSIQHTVRYTELAPTRFKSLFQD